MKTFQECVDVAADPAAVFDLTQDYHRRLEWDPFLREARLLLDAEKPGLGVKALCVSRRPRIAMETVYVSFDRPRVAAVRMTAGPWFLRDFAGSWRFEPIAGGKTRVTFTYSLTAQPAFLRLLVVPIFKREMRGRMKALRRYLEPRRALLGVQATRQLGQ